MNINRFPLLIALLVSTAPLCAENTTSTGKYSKARTYTAGALLGISAAAIYLGVKQLMTADNKFTIKAFRQDTALLQNVHVAIRENFTKAQEALKDAGLYLDHSRHLSTSYLRGATKMLSGLFGVYLSGKIYPSASNDTATENDEPIVIIIRNDQQ